MARREEDEEEEEEDGGRRDESWCCETCDMELLSALKASESADWL